MRSNRLRGMKAAGTPIVNAWLSIGSAYAAETVVYQGFDAATVDCQHGMMGFETALAMLQAISTTDVTPLVRPPALDPASIMRFLDAGAYGVICPMISSAADAIELVRACRYPPDGARSYGPARGLLYGGADYLDHANAELLVIAMVETKAGLDNLDEILAVPGLDGIYVGPNDLALALGYRPENESRQREVCDAIETIRARTVERGLIAGIFCSNGQAAAGRIAQGFDLVTPGNDAALLRGAMRKAVDESRGQE